MKSLHNVTCGCSLVTHGACQRWRKSGAAQSCTRFAAAVRLSAGCRRQDGSRLLSLATPSVSIPSTSRTIEAGCSGMGCQDCFHRQAFRKVGRTSALIRQHKRLIAERPCESRSRGFSPAEEESWVNGHEVGTTRFNWNIDMIACYPGNWNRSTKCWSPTSDGRLKRWSRRRIKRRN